MGSRSNRVHPSLDGQRRGLLPPWANSGGAARSAAAHGRSPFNPALQFPKPLLDRATHKGDGGERGQQRLTGGYEAQIAGHGMLSIRDADPPRREIPDALLHYRARCRCVSVLCDLREVRRRWQGSG